MDSGRNKVTVIDAEPLKNKCVVSDQTATKGPRVENQCREVESPLSGSEPDGTSVSPAKNVSISN